MSAASGPGSVANGSIVRKASAYSADHAARHHRPFDMHLGEQLSIRLLRRALVYSAKAPSASASAIGKPLVASAAGLDGAPGHSEIAGRGRSGGQLTCCDIAYDEPREPARRATRAYRANWAANVEHALRAGGEQPNEYPWSFAPTTP